jgi:D-galactarolactone cycloisomerase
VVRHRLRSVEFFPLRTDLATPRGPSIHTYHSRETLFIKVSTEDGLIGWGETYRMAGVESAIRDVLAPLIVGREAIASRELHEQMLAATFGNGFAVSGVDLALHDVWGKSIGVPVHALYGGARRSRVEAYASLPGYYLDKGPEDHWSKEIVDLTEWGFHAVKLRIGRYPPERELALLKEVRQAVGSGVRLMADANAAYSPAAALRVGRALEELDFDWLEEPLPQSGYHGYPELRAKLGIPLAGGEGLGTRWAAAQALQQGCFDIVQPDVSICGGIREGLFIGELAQLSAVRCIPHCWAGGITLAATLHLAALLPEPSRMPGVDASLLEVDVTENPFRDEVVIGEPFKLTNGYVDVPEGPGLGIEIDEEALRRYSSGAH